MNDVTENSSLYLNVFADTGGPVDMTQTDEFASLLTSAVDLSIPHAADIAYRSCNIVVRHHRFHFQLHPIHLHHLQYLLLCFEIL